MMSYQLREGGPTQSFSIGLVVNLYQNDTMNLLIGALLLNPRNLNNIHSTIKFTSSHSSTNIPFLDVNVSLTNDGNISTDLYTKPTDKHQHLLYSLPSFTYKKSHSFQSCTPFTTYLFYRRYISYSHCSTCHLPP